MIRLVSLNVERSKHLDLILPFLERVKPDVVCLMEVMDYDIPRIQEAAGKNYLYEPMSRIEKPGEKVGMQGVGIFSRLPLAHIGTFYYHGDRRLLTTFDAHNKAETNTHMLLVGEVEGADGKYTIGTTHFPVTPNGQPDDVQRKSVTLLLNILEQQGEIIFCGDLNAPRGGEIFAEFAAHYKDNVPAEYTISLDVEFHRASAEALAHNAREMGVPGQMVDYIFSTPSYSVSDFSMHSGVSDHKALIATVSKN